MILKILCIWTIAVEIILCLCPASITAAKQQPSFLENLLNINSNKKKRELLPLPRYDRGENNFGYLRPDYYNSADYYNSGQPISFYRPVDRNERAHDIPLFQQYFPYYKQPSPNIRLATLRENGKNSGINIKVNMNQEHKSEIADNEDKQIVGKKSDYNLAEIQTDMDQNDILTEENPTDDKPDHKDNRMRTFSFAPFFPHHLDSQPEYQNPSYFDPTKQENKQQLVKFLDGQSNFWEKIWSEHDTDKFHYNGPKYLPKPTPKEEETYSQDSTDYNQPEVNAEEKTNLYDPVIQGYGDSVSKPPLPTVYSVEVDNPTMGKKEIPNTLNAKNDYYANLISGLQENGDLLIDMLRPITTHMDIHLLKDLQLLNKFNKNFPQLTPTPNPASPAQGGYANRLLESPKNPKDPTVGRIIRIPNNYYNHYYKRNIRSTNNNSSTPDYLNLLIQEGSEILNFLKKMAKSEKDVMILEYFAAEILHQLSEHMDKDKNIKKRSVPVAHLLMDPSTKVDFSKTFENVGTLMKTVLEHRDTPMFHVRNLVGSAKDVMLATMKIPNQNFIIPSGYDIIDNPNKDEALEVPGLSSRFGDDGNISPHWPEEMVSSTFQQVGQVIRDNIRSSQAAINHIGDITNHAKKAILSARNTPDLIKQTITPIPLVSANQPVGIRSRFGDEDVGETEKKPDKFINISNLLDAVGISNPNRNLPGNTKNVEQVSKNLNALQESLGIDDIYDFIVEMKEKLKNLRGKNNPLETNQIYCGGKRYRRNTGAQLTPLNQEDGTFGPVDLTHPFGVLPDFLHFNSDNGRHVHQISFQHTGDDRDRSVKIGRLDLLLDESPKYKSCNCQTCPVSLKQDEASSQYSQSTENLENGGVLEDSQNYDRGYDDERVSTLLKLKGNLIGPFAGLAKEKEKEMFHKQFEPSYSNEINTDQDNYGYWGDQWISDYGLT